MKTPVIAVKLLFIMTILTGIVYPLTMTGISQLFFPYKANGSLIYHKNTLVGSELIGQKFDSIIYFWPRPSATDYNTLPALGSNLGPSSLKLKNLVDKRREIWIQASNQLDISMVPVEMIFASGSGIDPHISPDAALLQADRVAAARSFTKEQRAKVSEIIERLTEKPQYLFLGEPRINVFELNLSIDSIR
jgi:K+-transporting ATPase ATPase C chain